jgi:pyruvate/2-oxoglutarate/acetoin dehydrogenase E1 component
MNAPRPQARKTLNTIQAVNLALDEALGADPNVILLGEDIADEQAGGICGVTKGLSQKYAPRRSRSRPSSARPSVRRSSACGQWPRSC